jgi:hypothetical protein
VYVSRIHSVCSIRIVRMMLRIGRDDHYRLKIISQMRCGMNKSSSHGQCTSKSINVSNIYNLPHQSAPWRSWLTPSPTPSASLSLDSTTLAFRNKTKYRIANSTLATVSMIEKTQETSYCRLAFEHGGKEMADHRPEGRTTLQNSPNY